VKQAINREELKLSWEGEAIRKCHFHVARGPELTNLLSMEYTEKMNSQRRALEEQSRKLAKQRKEQEY